MIRRWASWLAVALFSTVLATPVLGDSLTRGYASETTLVFSTKEIVERRIAYRIRVSDGEYIQASQVLGDCAHVAPQRGALVIYMPGSRICSSLSRLMASGGGKSWDAAGLRGLRQDRSKFTERLESSSMLRIEPHQQHVFRGQVCYCPVEPGPDSIFSNGFEGLAALL